MLLVRTVWEEQLWMACTMCCVPNNQEVLTLALNLDIWTTPESFKESRRREQYSTKTKTFYSKICFYLFLWFHKERDGRSKMNFRCSLLFSLVLQSDYFQKKILSLHLNTACLPKPLNSLWLHDIYLKPIFNNDNILHTRSFCH